MRCAIISRAGQVLARGALILRETEGGAWRLDLETDGGRQVQGGLVGSDGNLTEASQVLFDQFFDVWGMSNLTLTVTLR
ncbi:hypothetical protein VB712_05585 [Spirulina sp. CCNP1310]|uniref:hypothetical protein n=1 Tax=Spirulina sp. CCNP1310 TaxID=3110249 RepID=UPI002B216C3D|nr:hypothetical protein [Spirulina sp. CCNP1310]MEA5418691.1 hypothetical protein [Spirulina sp. CCNP1310]